LAGRGFVNAFRNLGLTPGFGGDVRARLTAPIGRRHQLGLSATGRSDPFYSIGGFAPLRGAVEAEVLPEANPVNGFSIRRSFCRDRNVAVTSPWTPRDTMTMDFGYSTQDFRDDIGDGRTYNASLGYQRSIGRRSSLRVFYRGADSEFVEQTALVRPTRTHTVEAGYDHDRQVSRTRRMAFGFGAGATYVDTVFSVTRQRLDYVMPSGFANTRLDIARTWSIWADYRRAVGVLEGVTAEAFMTDAAIVRVGGMIGSRTELVVSGAYSNGAGVIPQSESRFETYTGTAQVRFMVTRWWSALVSQNIYSYQLHGFDLPEGLLPRLNRNATRVGMTFQLPLYGAYMGRPARGAASGN
jgi:hypothetical protein